MYGAFHGSRDVMFFFKKIEIKKMNSKSNNYLLLSAQR